MALTSDAVGMLFPIPRPVAGYFSCHAPALLFQQSRHHARDRFFRLRVTHRAQTVGIEIFNPLCQSAHVPR